MSEKTAEEKLREELEGNSADIPKRDKPEKPVRKSLAVPESRSVRSRSRSRKTERPESVGRRVDSFMEDFEKRVAESLNTSRVSETHSQPSKPRAEESRSDNEVPAKIAESLPVKHEAEAKPDNVPEPAEQKEDVPVVDADIPQEITAPVIVPEAVSAQSEPEPIAEPQESQEAAPSVEEALSDETLSETTSDIDESIEPQESQDISQSEDTLFENAHDVEPQEAQDTSTVDTVVSETQPDVDAFTESNDTQDTTESVDALPENSPDAIAEPQDSQEIDTPPESDETQEAEILPEPETLSEPAQELAQEIEDTHEPEDLSESQDSQDDEPVIPVDLVEPSEEEIDDELPDIPVIDAEEINSPDNDELPDIPVISSEADSLEQNADFTESNDDFSEFTEETEDSQTAENLLPPADVIVSVDSELPDLTNEPQETDPESESVPVTVTMPESTKTAEDKLMADIAEAMTGSPLTLDSLDDSQPYKLPEDFMSVDQDSINFSDPQSAEDKLIANISQAMSESPIGAAQDNANQNLEDDLNPFDEMPLPAATPSEDFDYDEPEDTAEGESEPFLPNFSDYSEQQNEIESEAEQETEHDSEQEDSELTEGIVDKDDDIHDDFSDLFAVNPAESDAEQEAEDNTPPQEENDAQDFSFPDISDDILSSNDSAEVHEETETQPEQLTEDTETHEEPLTAEDRLAQEIAAFSQQDNNNEINSSGAEITPEEDINIDTQTQKEEADSQDNMPDQNLLPDDEMTAPEIEDDDDFDMSSLGDAASIYDDSSTHEEFSEPEPEQVQESEQEVTPTESYSFKAGEQKETEKTMTIRGKLKAKKDGEASSGGGRSGGGLLVPILLALVLLVGALSLFKLYDIADKLTLAGMNTDTSITVSSPEAVQSYEYAIDFIIDNNITERMAARGREGWQVVGSRRTQDTTTNQYGYEFIFMRRMAGRQ